MPDAYACAAACRVVRAAHAAKPSNASDAVTAVLRANAVGIMAAAADAFGAEQASPVPPEASDLLATGRIRKQRPSSAWDDVLVDAMVQSP